MLACFVACGGDGPTAAPDAGDGEAPPRDASADATVTPPSDASAPDAACALTENDAGTCSDLEALGPTVTATCVLSEPPQAQGGTIVDGTYTLQSFTYYGVCPTTPDIARTTWSICGDHWDVAQVSFANTGNSDGSASPVSRFNFRTTVQASSVAFDTACEPPVTSLTLVARTYTASPGHLMFIYPDATTPGRTFVSSYARQ
jgi:hypothetical protein